MPRTFRLPDVGEGVAEGELVTWLVSEGDTVEEDQPVAEVETDKAVVDVPSPVNGTVRELTYEEGDVVPVGEVIMVYNVEGEDDLEATADAGADEGPAADDGTDAEPGSGTETGALEASAEADAAAAAEDATDAAASEDSESVGAPEGRVFAPPSTRRLARELGVDLEQVEGSGHSGRITDADVRAYATGGTAAVGATPDPDEASTGGPDDAGTAAEPVLEESTPGTAAAGADLEVGSEPAAREKTLATPATRRVAEEAGVDIDAVPTDEEKEGQAFVTEDHVREYAEAHKKAQAADRAALSAGRSSGGDGRRETREPYAGVRKSIGDAMERAKYTAPHVTHHDEVDVTDLVEARTELKPLAAERDLKLTYMPFVMKACTAALREYPIVNSSLDEDEDEVVTKHYYNLGVATATDAGLMVPVVDDVDRKGLFSLQAEMNDLVEKARDRSIAVDEMRGGTFTITNVGGIGGEYATPILNYPEAAILALGSIQRKPRVVTDDDGTESIEPRDVLTVSLSFDHRIIDGAVAARFTNEVKEYLENPNLLLAE